MQEGERAEGSGSSDLACVSCRARKLKCDRIKPQCTRCQRVQGECVYPESRRKPSFKRRNVKELEARLAQVEDLLRNSSKTAPPDTSAGPAAVESSKNSGLPAFGTSATDVDWQDVIDMELTDDAGFFMETQEGTGSSARDAPMSDGKAGFDLIDLGMFETLPPHEVLEELHTVFFSKQQHFIPILHPGRYLRAWYSPPHMRPPMCLQYAIWAMASSGHEKYNEYADVFYQRARNYANADEMKGAGEHFITVAHAQTWALIATLEARNMLFTRAAMSSARCIKLVHMMGLHLLDSDGDVELPPTILPPQNWTELEERRRVFWGAFAIDSHASISTGWPTLIDVKDVTTHLPSFELAFNTEKEEKTCTLTEALTSSSYSSFSGSIIMCYILNQILRHVHRPKADDRPEDVEYGAFWKRHRDLDNMLAGVFMFLPENFRLPRNVRDPVAVHTNMNLHAAVICLHNAAIDRADQYKLPTNIRKISLDRCHTAAAEIVGIVKLTSHQINMGYKSPLIALALYCAASVYIYQAKEDPGAMPASNLDNLEFVLRAMEAIGRDHMVTRSFLQQVVIDIEHNGILTNFKLPKIDKVVMEAKMLAPCAHNIPILARAAISRHTKVQSPLPGRLPLGNGRGTVDGCVSAGGVVCSPEHMGNWTVNVQAVLRAQITAAAARAAAAAGASQQSGGDSRVNDDDSSANSGNSHKRKRHSPPDNSTTAASGTPSLNSSSQTGQQQPSFSRMGIGISNMHGKQAAVTAARNPVVRLPDRTGSPSPRPSPVGISPTTSTSAATPSSSTSSNPGRPNVHRRPSARGAVTVMGFVGTSAMATDLGSREPRQQQHQHLSSNQLGRDKAAVFEAIMADLGMGTTSPLSFKDYVSYSPRLDADVDGATAGGVGREKQYPVRDDDDEADGGDDDGDTSSDQFLGLRRSSGPGPSLGAGDVVWCNTSANDARAVIVDLESIMLDGGQTASSTTTYTGSTSATNADDDSPGVAGWEIGGAGPGHR